MNLPQINRLKFSTLTRLMSTFMKFRSLTPIFILFLFSSTFSYAQTSGTLTFSFSSLAPKGTYGNKCVMAIWIEDSSVPSKFVKTKAKYGHEDDHLTSWGPKSGKNLVDAVSGATLPSANSPSVIWNGTNVANVVVADGVYNIFIEMGWGSDHVANHSVMSFSFEKGPNAVHLTPTGNAYFSGVVIDWAPLTTLINLTEDQNNICVFPNPTDGPLNLEIKQGLHLGRVEITNSLGSVIFSKSLEEGFTGKLDISLDSFKNGLYLLKVSTQDQQFVYKVLLQK
jgi:hypothetical protein